MVSYIELLFVVISVAVYFLFDRLEICLIEWNYEKSLKYRLFLGKGKFIDLTEEEFDSIKKRINKSARDIIEINEKNDYNI